MDITEDSLHRCLWALPDNDKRLRLVIKAFQALPTLRALVTSQQHNFVPVFCLPRNSTIPILRSRVALSKKQPEIMRPSVVQVQVSACIPAAIYGETQLIISAQGCAYNFLKPTEIGVVQTPDLLQVEQAVVTLLQASGIELLTREMTARPLPASMQKYSLATYLDALFMNDDYPY